MAAASLVDISLVCAGWLPVAQEVYAQEASPPSQWSEQEVVSISGMFSANPEIIADSSSVVHMVWLARMLEEENCAYDTVMYSRIENGRWTPPRDVLLHQRVGVCLIWR